MNWIVETMAIRRRANVATALTPAPRRYLRGDSDAEYARPLRAIFAAGRPAGRSPLAGTFAPNGAAMGALRRQLDAGASEDAVTPPILALVTPVPCPTCRAPFIRHNGRQVYCERRCGALMAAARRIEALRADRRAS